MTSGWDPGALCPDAITFLRHGAAGVPLRSLSTAWQPAECGAIIKGYAGEAGFTLSQVNK
jgi:hypothetical protein